MADIRPQQGKAMRGFKPNGQRKEALGLIEGEGTGTSDSIAAQIPQGSYVMPADSTQAIGPEKLAQMGRQLPVRVSHGEYGLSPEQVHAVGVQALDQMKDATHTPVRQASGFKPEVFFANGGVVNRAAQAVGDWGRGVGEYWAADNARYQQQHPGVMASMQRSLNPVTGLGSAIGQMYQSAQAGDEVGMALAALSATPVFAAAKGVKGLNGMVRQALPVATGKRIGGNMAQNAIADQYPVEGHYANGGPVWPQRRVLMPPAQSQPYPLAGSGGRPPVLPPSPPATPPAAPMPPSGPSPSYPIGGVQPAVPPAGGGGGAVPPASSPAMGSGGLMGRAGKIIGGMGRAYVPFAAGSAALAGAGTDTEQYRQRFGLEADSPTLGGDLGVRALGLASDVGNALTFGQAGRFYRDLQQQKGAPPVTTQVDAPTVPPPRSAVSVPDSPAEINSAIPSTPQIGTSVGGPDNNVTKIGNSYSGGVVGPGFTVNGKPFAGGLNPEANSAQNRQAVQNLLANTPEFGKGFNPEIAQQVSAGIQQSLGQNAQLQSQRQEDRQFLMNQYRMANMEPKVNGQFTQAQKARLTELEKMMMGVSDQAFEGNKQDSANQAALDRQRAADQAALQRTAMTEEGATRRTGMTTLNDREKFLLGHDLDSRKFADEHAQSDIKLKQLQRIQNLYDKYDAAKTPEERSAALQQLQALGSGATGKDRYLTVGGGQEWDQNAMAMVNRPQQVFDTQSGQYVTPTATSAGPSSPAAQQAAASKWKDGDVLRGPDGQYYYWKNGKAVPANP